MAPRRRARKPGRPTLLLNNDITETLRSALKLGVPVSLACQGAGISESVFYKWMQRGWAEHEDRAEAEHDEESDFEPDEAEQPYVDLYLMVTKARSEAALRNVSLIQRVAQGGIVTEETTRKYRDENGEMVTETSVKRTAPDWRASAWYLERAHRSDYAKGAEQVEISGPGGGPVQIGSEEISKLSAKLSLHMDQAMPALAARPAGGDDQDDDSEVYDAEVVNE
jgi:hypothetical protein